MHLKIQLQDSRLEPALARFEQPVMLRPLGGPFVDNLRAGATHSTSGGHGVSLPPLAVRATLAPEPPSHGPRSVPPFSAAVDSRTWLPGFFFSFMRVQNLFEAGKGW